MKTIACSLLIVLIAAGSWGQVPDAREILKKIDENMVIEQARSETTMIIHSRRGSRTIKSRAWTKGNDKTLVEYLSPPRERGKKMLKLGDKIWTYTPEPTDRIIAISGHLLRQSVMGSDLSYEDITDNSKLAESYDADIIGDEVIGDRKCWVLKMTALDKDVTYYSRKIWVDAERWISLKGELYAKSGRLLKTFVVKEVMNIGGRWYPKKLIYKDALSKGEGTEFIIDSIDFDVDIPDHLFTKAALRK